MARRSEHSLEEIRAMVLGAAEIIVVESGFSALKMRKIAMGIGYSVGSIYMVFANMADLIMHLKAKTLDDIAEQMEQVQDCAPEQCIEELAKRYLSYASQNYNRWRMIFEHRLPEDKAPGWYQEKINHVFGRFETQFAQLAPRYSESQKKQAAHALWGGIHGICVLSLTGKLDIVGVNDIEGSVVLLVRNFIRGWVESA